MSLTDKTTTHNDGHNHDNHGSSGEHEHDTNVPNPISSKDIFELVRSYQGNRFLPVDDQNRKTFYQSLVGQSFTIKSSDFISLDDANFQFDFIPAHDDHHCDLNIIVTHPKRNSIQFTAFEESVLTFLSEKSFVIKSYVKLNDNKVNSKFYAMTISVVDNQPSSNYVFSFSFTNLEDEDEKIRVYVNHKQPATAGVGRD